ncbi:hypothetical protein [Nocardia testacea]|uniref:hypothetical protein n=1 Tax=Nocardia testacea TaxID=248551 RepID=UPI0033D8FDCD
MAGEHVLVPDREAGPPRINSLEESIADFDELPADTAAVAAKRAEPTDTGDPQAGTTA